MKCLCVLLLLAISLDLSQGKKKPHIIFFLADDLGWDDVSFHGSSQIPTPNIDKYASEGVILNNYYVSPMCTPTRASLMTGKYPIHLGLQHFVIFAAQPSGLPLDEVTIANYLKSVGYKTHAVGKWHLGFFKKEYTPTHRGFDTFYGFWNSKDDYWDHTSKETGLNGKDLRDNMEKVKNETGTYGPDLFTRVAVERIRKHDPNQPMFMYVSQQAVHSANVDEPLQAPAHLIRRFKDKIDDPKRQVYAGMVTALDNSFGNIMLALKQKDMLKDSIVVFSTDNGGAPYGFNWNMGSNYPLRGGKDTLWEGGVRGAAFVYSDSIKSKGRVCKELIDVSDWVPTLFAQAGGDPTKISKLDGKDVWETISKGEKSPRIEILHNIDPRRKFEAIRHDNWKLIVGMDDWYSDIGWHPRYKGSPLSTLPKPKYLRQDAIVKCGPWPSKITCNTKKGKACLFDMNKDPCEYHDLSAQYPAVVKRLKEKLDGYRGTMKPVWYPGLDVAKANPKLYDNFWNYWDDKDSTDDWLINEKFRWLNTAFGDKSTFYDVVPGSIPAHVQSALVGVHNGTNMEHMFHYHYHKDFPIHIPNLGEIRTMKYRHAQRMLQQRPLTTILQDKIQGKVSDVKPKEHRPLKTHEVPFHVPGPVQGTHLRKGSKTLLSKRPKNKLKGHRAPKGKGKELVILKMRPLKKPLQGKGPESSKPQRTHANTATHKEEGRKTTFEQEDHNKVLSKENQQEDPQSEDDVEEVDDDDESADSYQQPIPVIPYQAPQYQKQPTANPWVYNSSNGWPSHNTTYMTYG